jgi:demethylmenaquinone methyltransferase/2-methoxy-6-polyprenyl-1,4-benzoquinol methylase
MSNTNSNNYISQNNKFFGRWARLYDYEKYFLSGPRIKAVKFLDLQSSKKILDVATGTGAQAFELAKFGHDVIGIDLSPEMIFQANKKLSPKLKLKFMVADGVKLPFVNESFDIVTISLGIHEMPYEIGIKVLKEMKRVLKNDGKMLIIDYMNPINHWVAKITHQFIKLYEPDNYRQFIKNGLENYIKKVQLTIIKDDNYLGVLDYFLLRKRQ